MRDYNYVDARGMGVRRKIVPLTKELSGKDAMFELTGDYLKVTLPATLKKTMIIFTPSRPQCSSAVLKRWFNLISHIPVT